MTVCTLSKTLSPPPTMQSNDEKCNSRVLLILKFLKNASCEIENKNEICQKQSALKYGACF